MLPDKARAIDTQAWLQRALGDLRAAEVDLLARPPLTADAVFHCQQLTEKALKAFLVWHDVPFRRTHSLIEIGRQCVSLDESLDPLLRRSAPLSEYAWRFRYPVNVEDPSLVEAQEALALAREVLRDIAMRLPLDIRPHAGG